MFIVFLEIVGLKFKNSVEIFDEFESVVGNEQFFVSCPLHFVCFTIKKYTFVNGINSDGNLK